MISACAKALTIILMTISVFGYQASEPDNPSHSLPPYPGHLTGAFTGGFGEESCHSCHFDYDLNWEDGKLSVSGIPDVVLPQRAYAFIIEVKREDLAKAGFQMSARYEDGRPAGIFGLSNNDRQMFTDATADSVQYIQHSAAGTLPVDEDDFRWTVHWESPDSISGRVIFNIAANASNGDQSEFGDWIYVQEFSTSPGNN
ncbi:MAG: hypothetical protein FH748_14910 [Balneolaceae bacterium]|nr:hypothetical protein [Balneolaceae bacterium]